MIPSAKARNSRATMVSPKIRLPLVFLFLLAAPLGAAWKPISGLPIGRRTQTSSWRWPQPLTRLQTYSKALPLQLPTLTVSP